MSFPEDAQKRQRVSKACDNCRRKKVRCDGLQPTCSNCGALSLDCTYLETTRKRGPPKGYIEAIENKLHRLEHLLSGLVQSDPRAAECVLNELQKVEGLDDVRLRLASRARPSEFHELRKRDEERLKTITQSEKSSASSTEGRGVWDLVMEALSDEANQLTLEDQGRVRYMGFSSGFYLLQNSAKYQDGLFRMKPLTQSPPDSKDTELNPFVLAIVLEIYFRHINPIIPLLHKEEFAAKLRNDAQELPLLLLNAMFALAANLSSEARWLEKENARSEIFYKRAKRLLDQSYDVTSLQNVQALVLLSHYFHITHGSMKSWVYSGMAIRLAEDLGLHRNPDRWQIKTLSDSVKEARKRTWWSCYVMDRSASASMGRPLCIDDRHCDTSFPQIPTEELCESGTRMDVFVEVIKLHEIFGRIMNNVYAIRTHPTQNPFKSEAILLELDSALHKWLVELPPDLQYNPQQYFNGKKPASNVIVYLHVLYHSALVLLHRPYIPNPNSKVCATPYPSLQICTTSANSITAITHMCSGESGLEEVLVFVLFPIFTAATVHLANMTTKDEQLKSLAKKNLSKNMSLLSKIRKRWGSAGKYYIVIRELLIARNITLEGVIEQDPAYSDLDSSADLQGAKASQPKYPGEGPLPANQTPSLGYVTCPIPNSIPHGSANIPGPIPTADRLKQEETNIPTVKEPTLVQENAYNQIEGTRLSGLQAAFETITNVGFDPSAPSNTLSEMTVNNQHLMNQLDHTSGAPIWNVPLSFNFDEWNEYVGEYSRNICSPVALNNQGSHVPSALTLPLSPKKETDLSQQPRGFVPGNLPLFAPQEIADFAPVQYQPMPPTTIQATKYGLPSQAQVQPQPWQLYNARR
ncbi:hypothetical protein K493DRAFT_313350 [Basidiobolus meristosporus CBS 931.73]|uniref:Zn(2)-C6 fungal-type domain-containing protein n=1 Tax=Basidiobolus meristosporus CBS 931.73 TaxID=1314790 RepID=A0A1Y1YM67_9FUNG|nr:hypothetical protein K493DRAFT_313350 [Basidiobolus meristosporus CBS 931.73]|eukprot:ORX99110.1 hypothetical protein K493DRAFT_313350 [Basidiobolus meristosporus CBS 931.73]